MFASKKNHGLLYVVLTAALLLTAAENVHALDRAPPQKVQELAEQAREEGILKQPVQNYRRIRGLFIKSGAEHPQSLIKTFRKRLEGAETPLESAVLHYLIAQCHRHDAIQKLRSEHEPGAMEKLHKTALPHLVTAFIQVRQNSEENEKKMLKTDIGRALNRLLAGGAGAKVGADMRKKLIETYIEAPSSRLSVLDIDKVVAIYRDLGIEDRLLEKYAKEPGKIDSYKALLQAMRHMRALKGAEAALPYAETLWQDYSQRLVEEAADVRRVMEVYTEVKPRRVLESFTNVTERHPRLYLQRYYAARQAEKFSEKEKYWREYLLPYLKRRREELKEPLDAHHGLSRRLEESGDFEAALFVIRRALNAPGAAGSDKYGYLLLRKARCLRALGRTAEARKAYVKCSQADAVESLLRENAREKLKNLNAESGSKKAKERSSVQ